jgi:two-component system, chemotaxis family, protein-glutamate methylesterase/glutaminase
MHSDAGIALVVIADDSELVTAYLEQLCERDPQIRIVGRARDGRELLQLPALAIARVVLLDLLMPELGGLSLIKQLAERAIVIAISSEEADSALAREALLLGAAAFFSKRSLAKPAAQEELRRVIKQGVPAAAARGQAVGFLVGSTGAIAPLEQIVRSLRDTPAPLLVVQHLPDGRAESLAQLLHHERYPAHVALHGEQLRPGVFVAPAGKHMAIDERDRIVLSAGEPGALHCPSGDVLLRSAARLGPRAVGIVLSGLGDDGAKGMTVLAERGGKCFAQHPDEAQALYMPRAAATSSSRVRYLRDVELGTTLRKLLGDG